MKKPDTLLTEIERSIFVKALVISTIAHVVLLAVTSFSLFADWGKYGFHAPSYINAQKSKENKEAEAARRKAEVEAKAEAAAKEKEAASDPKAEKTAPAAEGQAQAAASEKDEKVTPPEIEPLPPKKEFQLGDDLTLD
ncbi:MAG: hypothetical protein J6R63_03360 [Kiritimatiellae bacterium]|jgi:flagellar biosynthesis GTPase FlhF|nr:hypothetical protein [Kiritimatiellia bacterium]